MSFGENEHAPLKVLHVIPSVSPFHGGPSRAIVTIEKALVRAGLSVTTATTDDDGPYRRFDPGERPAMVNGADRVYRRKWTEFYKVAPGLAIWLWRNVRTYDIIHIHALFSFTSICAGVIARVRGVPYVVRPLGTLTSYGVSKRRPWLKQLSLRLIEGPVLAAAAAVHFTSEDERQEAIALGISFKAVVISLAVETMPPRDDIETAPVPSRSSTQPTILFLSRLDPKKNLESLLRAFAKLLQAHSGCQLAIAGDGAPNYVKELHRLAQSLDIEQNVRWCGQVNGDEKEALLACADIFVLPSVSENFGIAAAEALAAGLPCILGRGVAIAKDAGAAGAALAIDPNPDEILASLVRLVSDPTLRGEIGARARQHVEELYSSRVMAKRLIAVYTAIADTKHKAVA